MVRVPTAKPPGGPKPTGPPNYSAKNSAICETWLPVGAMWNPFKASRLK